MKKRDCIAGFLFACLLALLAAQAQALAYNPQSVGAGSPEVHINGNGTMTIKSARVEQITGTTLYLSTQWGSVPMRFTMKTDEGTAVVKRYGGAAQVPAIKAGDYLDVDGDFFVGSDFFGLSAKRVKDWSLQEENETFSGRIVEINPDRTFTLLTPLGKAVIVRVSDETEIKKGATVVPASRLFKGDLVVLADGVYDYPSNTLSAAKLIVFVSTSAFAARNYEGRLKSADSTNVPATLLVDVSGVSYKVILSAQTKLLKKNRLAAELARFVPGDRVRFYGPLREEANIVRDELIVDALLVRNLNL